MPRVKKNSNDEYNAPFATNLRELMDERGMNQSTLADYIGVTRQAVSAYSLGLSLPDIEKFEKIADFFDVSTEYLLGRTEVKRANITVQAISDTLQLSEAAIDKIHGLQKEFRFEQNLENDWKLSLQEKEPLSGIFSSWLEAVDLDGLMRNLYRAVGTAANAQNSGYHPEKFKLDGDDKEAVYNLKQRGYVTLTPTEQMEYYEQRTVKTFHQSVEKMESDIINVVIELCEAENAERNQT